LVDKIRRCRYSNTFYLFHQVSDTSELLLFGDEVHLRSEYIEIEVQDAFLGGSVVYISVKLMLVLYADHLSYESTLECWLDIVPDVAGEIGEAPCVGLVPESLIEIENMLIRPEIGVFVYMDERIWMSYFSYSYCLEPEVECVVMVVEDCYWWDGALDCRSMGVSNS
jgi:hypothetical protein